MKNTTKKLVALVLAGTMVLGSSMVALAENETSGSGTATGTGTSNGHVEQKVVSVTLPTAGGTTFDYIADPEDLVGQTKDTTSNKGKTKTGTEVTPNTDYIYFHNVAVSANEDEGITAVAEGYSSTSNTVRVVNKSSVPINLTVKAEVTANENNMAIADTAAELATATSTPTLHFDLLTQVKGAAAATSTPVTTTTAGSLAEIKDISVAGTAANFELTQATNAYSYAEKDGVKGKDWTWVDISLKGQCSNAETTDTLIAPAFAFTWAWEDPDAEAPSALSAHTISKASGGSITVTGKTVSSIVMAKNDGTNVTANGTTHYSLSGSTYTFAASVLANKTKITFNFSDSTSEEVTVE